ncbi:hypothetical protein BDW59DRAFT_147895 [Aspergillus cavernicola]|uniref:Uncharacterized protein n=1 Tax=Aspergillus cavernicola TaxID=176166 RepID=A0ABR4I8S4_9EURO
MPTSKPKDAFRITKTPKRLYDFATNLETALKSSLPSHESRMTRYLSLYSIKEQVGDHLRVWVAAASGRGEFTVL